MRFYSKHITGDRKQRQKRDCPQAPGITQTDVEKGVIKAAICCFDDFFELGSKAALLKVNGLPMATKLITLQCNVWYELKNDTPIL